ncbi:MAG TPA: DinB family protein [Gemmatimonadales bacterium]|nr:DinB family protein [Gemmatimonadales bacterium]
MPRESGNDGGRAQAIALLEEAFRGPAWHGPSLVAALRGVGAAEAAWRPAPGRNTIWELVLHAAYAKHVVLGRLLQRRETFTRPLPRPWWPAPPGSADEAAWRRDRALLTASHAALVAAVRRAAPAALRRRVRRPLIEHLAGVALHDTYHGGQISFIRKLFQGVRGTR